MIKLKFKNRDDEIKIFMMIREIEQYTGVKIRYAECISDLDQAERDKDDD